jgi:two-component system response regulator YesN
MPEEVLKVLIVDDEFLVRDLLKKCVNWAEIGYEVAGEASCAQEALDLIEQVGPDVIFTDICMPYIDGIEFARLVFEKHPLMKIVILTGYEEFEYAKRSVKIGIADFLLKPINDDEIRKVALELKEKIQTERNSRNEYARLKQYLDQNLPFLREKLLNELIQTGSEEPDLQRRFDYYGIRIRQDYFQGALIEVSHDEQEGLPGEEARLLLKMHCRELVSQYFREDEAVLVFLDNSQRTVVLNSDKELDLAVCLESVLAMLVNRMKCFVCIGIGNGYDAADQIRQSYREACNALDYKVIVGKNQVIGYSDIDSSANGHVPAQNDLTDSLAFTVKSGMRGKALELLDRLLQEGSVGQKASIESIRAAAANVVSMLLNVITEAGIGIPDIFGPAQPFDRIFKIDTFPDMKEYLKGAVVTVIDAIDGMRSRKVNQTVKQIQEYIHQNLANGELSLSGTAKAFYMNVSYLSRVFKQETGQTFVEYLTKARLEKAVKLLRETDMKAYQIAWEVGFIDPHYFGICFKRFTGMSVNDYKKDFIEK